MFQFLSTLAARLKPLPERATGASCDGRSDPMAHPALRAMTPAELADIPFPRPRPRRACATC